MKRIIIVVLLMGILMTSCGKQEEQIDITASKTMAEIREESKNIENTSNIDFSETKFIIPDVDSINDISFYSVSEGRNNIDTYDVVKNEFLDAIEDFTDETVNEDYITLVVWNDNRDQYTLNDVSEDVLYEGDKCGYSLTYNDGKESLLLYTSSFMCEMADEEVSKIVTPTENWLGFRPTDEHLVDTYNIYTDDIEEVSYNLKGEEVSLRESIEYVENEMKNKHTFFSSDLLDYKVHKVEVYKLDDDNYYYKMYVRAGYNGIALQYDGMSDCYPIDDTDYNESVFISEHMVDMMKKDSIDYLWSCAHTYDEENKEVGTKYDKFVSLKSAINLVSKDLSVKNVLVCSKVELLYKVVELDSHIKYSFYDEEFDEDVSGERDTFKGVSCHPIYLFEFNNTGLPDYPVIYYAVDATTGELLSQRVSVDE